MTADKRPNVYFEDDVMVIRASALGGCTRALVQTGMGIEGEPPPADLVKRWAEGNVAEPMILEATRLQGWKPLTVHEHPAVEWDDTGQPLVEVWVGKKIVVRCHPDGIAQCYLAGEGFPEFSALKDRRVLEAKALRPSFPRDFPPYLWQMSVEMAGTGLLGMWAYGNKNKEGVVQEVELVAQDTPPFTVADIKRRALGIYKAVITRDIPACETKQYPCPFYTDPDAACSREQKVVVEELPVELKVLAGVYQAAKRRCEKPLVNLDVARGKLKAALAEAKLPGEKYGGEGLVATHVPGKQGGVDVEKMKKAGLDVDEFRKPNGKDYWELRDA